MKISNKNSSIKDAFWYVIGFSVPIIINFIKSPIFTRYFTATEYGYLGIVSPTFQFLSIILFSCTSSCIWRYYLNYKKNDRVSEFYSTLFFINCAGGLLLIVIAGAWALLANISSMKILILCNIVQTILMQFIGMYLDVERIEGRAFRYAIMYISRIAAAFAILMLLVFVFKFRIEAMIISEIIINAILCVYIFSIYRKSKYISSKFISITAIKQFFNFGLPSMVCSLCILVLTASDRYVIKYYFGFDSVGVYNEIYKLSEISIYSLATVFFNTSMPALLKAYEEDFKNCNRVLVEYIKKYIILILPLAVYFSMFAKQIAAILLGEQFRQGYTMMPYIMFTTFLYGLSQFNQDKLKYSNKMSTLIKGFTMSAVLNIVLNILLLPIMGYEFSAATTLIAYSVLYLYYYFKDDCRYIGKHSSLSSTFPYILILLMQVLLDFLLRKKINIGVKGTILEGILFLSIYAVSVYIKESRK